MKEEGVENKLLASNLRHLVSTKVKATNCVKCNSGIWLGLVNGFEVKCDPTPLEPSAEIMLRLEGVKIYQTFGVAGSSFELQPRSAWHITKGDTRAIPLAEHRCGQSTNGQVFDLFPKPQAKEAEF